MAVDQPFGLLGFPGSPDLIVRFRLIVPPPKADLYRAALLARF